jgi:hypothetical protein
MSVFARASTSAGRPDNWPTSARNWAWSLFDDWHHVAQTIPRTDGNSTYDEHEHAGARLTCHEQVIPRFVAPNLAELAKTLDLLRPEIWEHLIAALFYGGHDRITRKVACALCCELYHVGAINR